MEDTIKRIVDLRQSGLTWGEVESILFPNSPYILTGKSHRESWKLACKHKTGLAAEAFSKYVIGCWGPTQIVVPIRRFDKSKRDAAMNAEIDSMLQEIELECALVELNASA